MADPKPEPTTDDKQGDLAVVKDAPPPDSGERKVPESALKTQAADFNKQIADLTKKVNASDAKDLAAKEAKMIEDGKQSDLIADLRKQVDDAKAVTVMDKRALLVASADSKLASAGMGHERMRLGALTGLPADATSETIDSWVAEMKGKSPEDFTKEVKPVGQASVGSPATGATDGSLKTRLQSDDPAVKLAALQEELVGTLSGELSPNREDRK